MADLVQKSIAEFPNAESDVEHTVQSDFPSIGRFQQVGIDDFLEDMAGCFDGN